MSSPSCWSEPPSGKPYFSTAADGPDEEQHADDESQHAVGLEEAVHAAEPTVASRTNLHQRNSAKPANSHHSMA